jgi:NADH dehydrogenase FAD-containing subunit
VGKHLVLVGGGHAHLTSLKALLTFKNRGHQVTLISLSPYHYYSGMGPGLLSGIYQPWEVRFHVKRLAENQGATFIKDKVIKIDPDQKLLLLSSGETVTYDVVSFNTGSEVPMESLTTSPGENVMPVKPIINLLRIRRFLIEAIKENKVMNLVVIGGGPAGTEISANLWRLFQENRGKGKITLLGGRRLLGDAPDKVRSLVLNSLVDRGVTVIEGTYAKAIDSGVVTLGDGRKVFFDVALVAIGTRPPSLFRDSGLPTSADGGLLVNAHLQCIRYADIFGGGDCVSLEGQSLARVGVYAVRENPILYHNLLAALEGGNMLTFEPQKFFLLILNMGNGQGIFWKKNWVWKSRLAFLFKNYIDRKFMRKFQTSGELNEQNDSDE